MKCEKSFITMKLIWHGYLVLSLVLTVLMKFPLRPALVLSNRWSDARTIVLLLLYSYNRLSYNSTSLN